MAHKIGRRKAPRRGSLQYWPRKRAKRPHARVRNWKNGLAFAGYKAGMTHVIAIDNRKTSPTKGEKIAIPVTIIEVPPLFVAGMRFYKNNKVVGEVWAEKLPKTIERKIKNILNSKKKKERKKIEDFQDYDYVRAIISTQPSFKKTPEIFEAEIEGELKDLLGKEIKAEDMVKAGEVVDAISITKGKGFAGVIKKFGATLLSHKSEKKRRKPGSISPWNPPKVTFRALMPGKIGFHQRTEFNKWILKIGEGSEINPKGGFINYGVVKADYIMLAGSVPGPKKRLIILRKAIRKHKFPPIPPEIVHISLKSKQGVGS